MSFVTDFFRMLIKDIFGCGVGALLIGIITEDRRFSVIDFFEAIEKFEPFFEIRGGESTFSLMLWFFNRHADILFL